MNVSMRHPTDRPNFSVVHLNGLTLYFSYETLIAFNSPDLGQVISENCWSATTGKHLNWIDSDKSIRKDRSEFIRLWDMTNDRYLIEEGIAA